MTVAAAKTRDALTVAVALVLAALASGGPTATVPRTISLVVAVSFAVLAWILRSVDLTGAICGACMAFVFCKVGGWTLFSVLLLVFCITSVATRISAAKLHRPNQPRGGAQVLANLFVPATLLVAGLWSYRAAVHAPFVVVAALAELTADTVSSEIGEAFGQPTLSVLTLRKVEASSNGGVSIAGTLAGIAGSAAIGASAVILLRYDYLFWLAAAAGVVGMLVDSYLGATLENLGWLNNEAVNLLGTASASAIAWVVLLKIPPIVC